MSDFIDEKKIFTLIEQNENPAPAKVAETIAKARELKGLSIEDTSVLLQTTDPDQIQEIYRAARDVKYEIYGKRLVLFAPLYITNECKNNCLYCAFRHENKELVRRTLSADEIRREVEVLVQMGHKRLLLVYGEFHNVKFLNETIETAYSVKVGNGEIRRINVNCAPLSVEDFKTLKEARIGTYQCFQETYHRETYRKMHPTGRKADYDWRVESQGRAQQAGIDDVSVGALFGLFDWKFELLAMLMHAQHLDSTFGVGPHTISFPRIEPALNSSVADKPPYEVSDDDFKKLVAVTRLAVPYTGMIMSTREDAEMRRELFDLGISQISAGSRTDPGGYSAAADSDGADTAAQFTLGDTRPLDEVIRDMAAMGYIPSFCTGCYRLGRTGADFMELAKPGLIREFCLPNAVLTFKEYLQDYASTTTREIGLKTIQEQLLEIPTDVRRNNTSEKLLKIEAGERDLYF